jgi:hypothetical protein
VKLKKQLNFKMIDKILKSKIGKVGLVLALIGGVGKGSAIAEDTPKDETGIVCFTATGWDSNGRVENPVGNKTVYGHNIKRCEGKLKSGENIVYDRYLLLDRWQCGQLIGTDVLDIISPEGTLERYVDRSELRNATNVCEDHWSNLPRVARETAGEDYVEVCYPGMVLGDACLQGRADKKTTQRYLDILEEINKTPVYLNTPEIRQKVLKK